MQKMLFTDSQEYSINSLDFCTSKKKDQKNWAFQVFYNKDLGSVHAYSELKKEAATSTEYHPLLDINQH